MYHFCLRRRLKLLELLLDMSRIFISSLVDNSVSMLFTVIEKESWFFFNEAVKKLQKPSTTLQSYFVVAFDKTIGQKSLSTTNRKSFSMNLSLQKTSES